ncbi:amino acid ABC transporter permease [Maritalea mediterranea]|uniref:ABC transporter permease subunit n=1 Tax=Maritalea mediterranea TaxID=2909667 RepID=A0ABS9E6S3_9HYPH|nr:amino acid ABC transporter permease [Maritalea mediterranea]MCF4097604.1 ABC transporter permease subunit [Maritalea mediterranea]
MNALLNMRSSNLVLLIVLPIFIYLTFTSSDYSRSFIAIIGAEPGAPTMLASFLALILPLSLGTFGLAGFLAKKKLLGLEPAQLIWLVLIQAVGLLVLTRVVSFDAFLNALVVNAIDAIRSEDVVPGSTPWQLTEIAAAKYRLLFQWILDGFCVLTALLFAGTFTNRSIIKKWAVRGLIGTNALVLFYLLFVAHLGFASGLFLSIRAVVFAYIAASILGLVLAIIVGLKPKKKTFNFSIVLVVLLIAGAVFAFMQPKQTYVVAGDASARVLIMKDTPSRLLDSVRESDWVLQSGKPLSILSTSSLERGLKMLDERDNVSGIVLPAELLPNDMRAEWTAQILPDLYHTLGFCFVVFAVIGAVLTLSGFQHGKHPIAIGAELFIDTIRGIPMLVIILYVGLPLAGNIRDISNGVIDMSGFWRGIVAISIGYSAYMAEIFRAGIQSVPKGQLEAAQALGLSKWHTARLVILPQAIRVITPALGNEFIAMLKDTSLLSVLSVRDITQRMREFQASSFLPFAPFNTAAILYVVLTLAIASALSSLERRQNRNLTR